MRGKGSSALSGSQAPVTARDCEAERGEEVKKPWRGGRITRASFFLSVFFHTLSVCQLSTFLSILLSPSLAQLGTHSHAEKCSLHIAVKLPPPFFPFFSFALHSTCCTLNIPCSILENALSPLCPRFVLLVLPFSISLVSSRHSQRCPYTDLGRTQFDCHTKRKGLLWPRLLVSTQDFDGFLFP